jgi:hypothetical protein
MGAKIVGAKFVGAKIVGYIILKKEFNLSFF